MQIIYQAMIYLLNQLHAVVGNYGWAIVILTVAIRAVLWPLNSAQTRSMKKMQELQPKIKALQAKFKDEPQKMQEAMMKFYAENSFNPMAGCLPMLVQLPIFLGLYGALSSPQFLAETANEHFLFLSNLSQPLQSHAGKAFDGVFNVAKDDSFSADHTVQLLMNTGKTQDQEVADAGKLIQVTPKPILPGSPMTFVLDFKALGLSDDYRKLIQGADVLVVDNKSRELEKIHFNNVNGSLVQNVPTLPGKMAIHFDILGMLLVYGALTLVYQQIMTGGQAKKAASNGDAQDAAAAVMQSPGMKLMPLLFLGLMFIIPIPAGALIYLVVTTALMLIQTIWVNMSEDKKQALSVKPGSNVIDIKADRA